MKTATMSYASNGTRGINQSVQATMDSLGG